MRMECEPRGPFGLRRSCWSIKSSSELGEEYAADDEGISSGCFDWDAIATAWEEEWHGASHVEINTFTSFCKHDSSKSCSTCNYFSNALSPLSHASKQNTTIKETPGGRVWSKVKSWLREANDRRRGIAYTKKGPCQLFEDWPIPAYPEDYDWNEDYQ